jgi:2-oxoglutarate dehydrogenase E2 component (dihydrolipoamide succinyltransferase)
MPVNIVVPELGESVVEATISQWRKKPGDAVAAGEAGG